MYLARIHQGRLLIARMCEYEGFASIGNHVSLRPRQPRAWRFSDQLGRRGATAISQSVEGAIASARAVLEQDEIEVPKFQRERA